MRAFLWVVCAIPALLAHAAAAGEGASVWTFYITNDNCPDYTWGFTEADTRRAFADIVRAHLDEMTRTDAEPDACRDRYNLAVTQEALCFLEHYPQRRDELLRRSREGRLFVSPYLCNSLWAFQSAEAAVRTFYAARRLERDCGVPMDVAEHIEEPSLPWGTASILAGCGVRWLSVPFYAYDSTFAQLRNPPVFVFEGPDGSRVRVVMDPWACGKWSYIQGQRGVLADLSLPEREWLPHLESLGAAYPLRVVLASGTHSDISPRSGDQARGFAQAIIDGNRRPGDHPRLVNATLPQFCHAADQAEAAQPFLTTIRGCFGHSWDVWPVSLAAYAAAMREGERRYLAAEALLCRALSRDPGLRAATRAQRERAEWCWVMLSDHAWNGTDDANRRHNADLRRAWAEELAAIAAGLSRQAWAGLGLDATAHAVTVFNALSVPRAGLLCLPDLPPRAGLSTAAGRPLAVQAVAEHGQTVLYAVTPHVPGYGLAELAVTDAAGPQPTRATLRATPTEIESPFYRLRLDPHTGGLASLVHVPSGAELAAGGGTLCQTVYHDGQDRPLTEVSSAVAACGPVLARLETGGRAGEVRVTARFTVYAELDRVDIDIRVTKPVTSVQERLCQLFPVAREGAVTRLETPAAVVRPYPQPVGDLLPGADPRRFAVQGFVDVSLPDGPGLTIAPLDAFVLRQDLGPIAFEAFGNDQNYREVVRDQHGVTEFRFRYALRAHAGGYDNADVVAWARDAAAPFEVATGRLAPDPGPPPLRLDPERAVAMCLKPADDPAAAACVVRLWETAGRSGPLRIGVPGCRRAWRTDLLERDLAELRVNDGSVEVDLPARGLAALRLAP